MIITKENIVKLNEGEEITFPILLLAEECICTLDEYIHKSEKYVYFSENEPLGIYLLHKNNEDEIEIKNIAVDKKYQGLGIGRLLLNNAIDRAKENNFKRITIGTWEFAHRQIRLYQSVGFEIYDRKRNFFINNYEKPIYENGKLLKDMIMLKKDIL